MKTLDLDILATVTGGIGFPGAAVAKEFQQAAAHPNKAADTCIKQGAIWGAGGAIAGASGGPVGAGLGALGGGLAGCLSSLVH